MPKAHWEAGPTPSRLAPGCIIVDSQLLHPSQQACYCPHVIAKETESQRT